MGPMNVRDISKYKHPKSSKKSFFTCTCLGSMATKVIFFFQQQFSFYSFFLTRKNNTKKQPSLNQFWTINLGPNRVDIVEGYRPGSRILVLSKNILRTGFSIPSRQDNLQNFFCHLSPQKTAPPFILAFSQFSPSKLEPLSYLSSIDTFLSN